MAAKKDNTLLWLLGGAAVLWFVTKPPAALPPTAATLPTTGPPVTTPGPALPPGGYANSGAGIPGGTPVAILPAPGPGGVTNPGGAGGAANTQIPPSNAPANTTPVTSAPVSNLPGVQSPLGNNDAEEIMEQNGDYKFFAPGTSAPSTQMLY